MYKIELVELPKRVLRKKSQDLEIPLSQENIDLANKMVYHIKESLKEETDLRPGVGVAAVQYGDLKNMFYVRVPEQQNNPIILEELLINPKLMGHSETKAALSGGEGCLSVNEEYPNQKGYIKRFYRVIVTGYSFFKKEEVKIDVSGYAAIVLQHELDHLKGKLFIDHINQKDPWKKEKNLILL